MFDARLGETYDRLDRRGGEYGIDDDGKRWLMPSDVFERVHLDQALYRRVGDDEISGLVLHRGLEIRPTHDFCESVLRAEDNSQMREQVTWEKRDDVHVESGSVS